MYVRGEKISVNRYILFDDGEKIATLIVDKETKKIYFMADFMFLVFDMSKENDIDSFLHNISLKQFIALYHPTASPKTERILDEFLKSFRK